MTIVVMHAKVENGVLLKVQVWDDSHEKIEEIENNVSMQKNVICKNI